MSKANPKQRWPFKEQDISFPKKLSMVTFRSSFKHIQPHKVKDPYTLSPSKK